jgi:hypothetical protein
LIVLVCVFHAGRFDRFSQLFILNSSWLTN